MPLALKVRNESMLKDEVKASLFAGLFFIVSLVVAARIPYFFERYYIFLQPIAIMIFLLVSMTVYEGTKKLNLMPYFVVVVVLSSVTKADSISGHIYELRHSYRGPMDYVVSYINENYVNTEDLVIATNYEEHTLMYYLNSRVIVGYVGSNLKEDRTLTPDIIIKRSNRLNNIDVLNEMLERNKYRKVVLDIMDYPVNNIPEQTLVLRHLFRSPITDNDKVKVVLYVKD